MTVSIPDFTDHCWPVDTSCCADFDSYPQEAQDSAIALAGQTMRMLTGYAVGGCPVDLRPCSKRCADSSIDWSYSGGTFHPHIDALGSWLNACSCGPSGCSCTVLSEIVLPAFAGAVYSVTINGEILPESAYRVDNGNRLVRLDGEQWPACQDMSALPDAEGSFVVRYLPARKVDHLGAIAAGLLACEYVRACSGKKCALPSGVTSVQRQGITLTITPGSFPGGLTGIAVVDAYILSINPYKLKMPSTIFSLDMPDYRVTTIPPGV